MVGTNIGAGNIARAKKIAWLGTAVSVIFTEVVGLLVAIFPGLWIGLFSKESAVLETGSLYFQIVAPIYAANGIIFALGFAAQGSGRMGRIFLAGAVRLVIAAGGGWIAVAAFGVPLSGLFALIDVALIIAAAICVAAALSGAMWPPVIDQAGTKTRSP
jgi:Na+-driven multidrug efflux pump